MRGKQSTQINGRVNEGEEQSRIRNRRQRRVGGRMYMEAEEELRASPRLRA